MKIGEHESQLREVVNQYRAEPIIMIFNSKNVDINIMNLVSEITGSRYRHIMDNTRSNKRLTAYREQQAQQGEGNYRLSTTESKIRKAITIIHGGYCSRQRLDITEVELIVEPSHEVQIVNPKEWMLQEELFTSFKMSKEYGIFFRLFLTNDQPLATDEAKLCQLSETIKIIRVATLQHQ